MHIDHAGGDSLVPRATFCIQQNEYRFWWKDPIAARPAFKLIAGAAATDYLATLQGTRHLALHEGDQQILPGIDCLLSPGHTVALQTVALQTASGTAIIGSDCAHVFRNYREDWPNALIVDLVGWMKSYDKLREKASSPDLLFLGHDRRLVENYPAVARDIARLV